MGGRHRELFEFYAAAGEIPPSDPKNRFVTGNDPDNLPMRGLNRRLGYRELSIRCDFERPAETRSQVPDGQRIPWLPCFSTPPS